MAIAWEFFFSPFCFSVLLLFGVWSGRIPVRLYIRSIEEDVDDLEDVPHIDSWDRISYLNRPVEMHKDEDEPSIDEEMSRIELEDGAKSPESTLSSKDPENLGSARGREPSEIKLIRIQGIEPKWDIPFSWVVSNLMNPEYYLHICVCIRVAQDPDKIW
ncbi:hypothetical protein IFM89_021715 [Coptis chinensis]|uniref:Autophagy protein 5 n=1 Tax=Coptis chinensis TaxID=261450 RepID=A0A835MAG2_9MAGN|nr:hypothetical protein IFM89_021715 [Coptis chinensis]